MLITPLLLLPLRLAGTPFDSALVKRGPVEAGLCGILCRLETVADTPVSSFPQRFVEGKSALSGIGAQSPGVDRVPIFRAARREIVAARTGEFAPGDHPAEDIASEACHSPCSTH